MDILKLPELRDFKDVTTSPPQDPGVYIFVRDGKCQYIGQTSNCKRRIAQHRTHKKLLDGDKVLFYEAVCRDERLQIETAYIALALPLANKAIFLRLHNGRITEIRWSRKKRKSTFHIPDWEVGL